MAIGGRGYLPWPPICPKSTELSEKSGFSLSAAKNPRCPVLRPRRGSVKSDSPRPPLCQTDGVSTDFPEGEATDRLRRPARIVRRARRRPAQPAPPQADGPAGLGLDPADLAGALLADLAEIAGQDDPFEFEMLVSSFCGILDVAEAAARDGLLPTDVLPVLVAQFEARRDGLSLAVLASLATLAGGEAGAAAARGAARLWQAGILPPDWFEELDRSILVEECLLVRREIDEDLLVLCSFRRAGRRHGFAVRVLDDEQGPAEAIAPLPAEAMPPQLADLVAELVPPDELDAVAVEQLAPVDARRILEAALRARAVLDGGLDLEGRFEQWSEAATDSVLGAPPYPTMTAALRARVESMPPPPRPQPGDAETGQLGQAPDWLKYDVDDAFPDLPGFTAALGGASALAGFPRPAEPADNTDDIANLGSTDNIDFAVGGDFNKLTGTTDFTAAFGAGVFVADYGHEPAPGRVPAGLPPRRGPLDGPAPVYRLRIDLKGAKPPIWRRVEVPGDLTLAALHAVIQTVFEWEGYHLHVFETGYGDFGDGDVDLGHGLDGEVTIEQILSGPGAKLTYVYDYGDYWEHVVKVERTHTAEPHTHYPRCTGGRRAAPPEDCGGLWEYLESLREHGDAGADVFDREELNRRLAEGRWSDEYRGDERLGNDRWDEGSWGEQSPS